MLTITRRGAFRSLVLALSENRVLSKVPHGEAPTPLIGFGLTRGELAEVKAMKASAAIVMHYGANDWSEAQVAGLCSEFARMNISVVAVTDAGFDPAKQNADIREVLKKKPQVIVSLPTDGVATANAYREAVKQNVRLVFMDNVPMGMEPGEDYVSIVSADNYGNGVACANLMAEGLHAHGKVAVVSHEADFRVTRQRYAGFTETIRDNYPDIEVVEVRGVTGPEFGSEARRLATEMLTKHRDIAGIWAVWDIPAEGVITAAKDAGREDLVVTTADLGLNVALELARGGLVFGVGAQRPFDQGIAEAELAGYGLLGKKAPPYVVLPALPVSRVSVLEAWESIYHKAPPEELIKAAS